MDTNVVIDFLNGRLPPNGQRLLMRIEPAISVITHVELFSSNRIPAAELLQLEQFVKAATVYDTLDTTIVQATINIRLQKKVKVPDAIIAATALVQGLTLLTRNTADFKQIAGLNVVGGGLS